MKIDKKPDKFEQHLDRWEKVRAKGFQRFLWINGFLGWGVTTGVLWSVVMSIVETQSFLKLLPMALITFPLGGLLWGWWVWSVSEKRYLAARPGKLSTSLKK